MARDPQPTLVITLDGKTDLDALAITSGAAADFAKLARPRTIQVAYSDGTGEELQLKDDPQPSAYHVNARHLTSITLRITSCHPAPGRWRWRKSSSGGSPDVVPFDT